MQQRAVGEKEISARIIVPAPLSEVWDAWTTETGAQSFFAPECRIDCRPGGAYEMLFNLDETPGDQGGEGMIVLAVQPERMLSFTWNTPPSLPNVRGQMTHVLVRMAKTGSAETLVTLQHDGWGEGDEWDDAFQYFSRVWPDVVLPRLMYRFSHGPLDWTNPPVFDEHGDDST